MPTIKYNDEFDAVHYPYRDSVKSTLTTIAALAHHPDPKESFWWYDATLHGSIFTLDWKKNGLNGRDGTIGVELIKLLADLEGVRWVRSGKDGLSVGFEHSVTKA